MRSIFFILTLLISTVLANTENIRFTVTQPSYSSLSSPYLYTLYDPTSISNRIRFHFNPNDKPYHLVRKVYPSSNGVTNLEWYKVEGTPGQMYEIRVCWPASSPTKFDIIYDESAQSVGVEYSIDYYSNLDELMQTPSPVDFEIILNKIVLFNTIPSDIAETIGLVMVGLIAGYYISKIPYNRCLF